MSSSTKIAANDSKKQVRPLVRPQRECLPSMPQIKRLVEHKTRLYNDYDSAALRDWVADNWGRLLKEDPQQDSVEEEARRRFWAKRAQDLYEPEKSSADNAEYIPLSSTLYEYTYKILGFKRGTDGQPPAADACPAKVVEAGTWFPRFCQYTAFQEVRATQQEWNGLDIWVLIRFRRIDICDVEMERRCQGHQRRLQQGIDEGRFKADPEQYIQALEENLGRLINGRLTAVYKYPNYKQNLRSTWKQKW